MSKITVTKPVGEIAAELNASIPLFENLHIDYCCGGNRSLQEACVQAGIPLEKMLSSLEKIQSDTANLARTAGDWKRKSMSKIIDYILQRHHAFTRDQLDRIKTLSAKVIQAHAVRHPELFSLDNLIRDMAEELEGHMAREEEVVFPYLREVEELKARGLAVHNPFASRPGEDRHPLSILVWEHGMTGEEWTEIHRLTRDFTTPAEACGAFKALYRSLKELEEDIHRHVHLENNVLFKRAIAMKVLD